MKDSSRLSKRRRYNAAFWAEALRLTSESRSTQAAARALNIDPKCVYKVAKGSPHTGGRQSTAGAGDLKKAIASACFKRRLSQTPDQ